MLDGVGGRDRAGARPRRPRAAATSRCSRRPCGRRGRTGYTFGLGIAVVLDAQLRDRQRETDEGKSRTQERAALEEARRRADAARHRGRSRGRARRAGLAEGTHGPRDAAKTKRSPRPAPRSARSTRSRRSSTRRTPRWRSTRTTRPGASQRARCARGRPAEAARRHPRAATPGPRARSRASTTATRGRSPTRPRVARAAVGVARRAAAPGPRGHAAEPKGRRRLAPARAGADPPRPQLRSCPRASSPNRRRASRRCSRTPDVVLDRRRLQRRVPGVGRRDRRPTSGSASASRPPRCAAGSAARSCSCSTVTAAAPARPCGAAACGCCSPTRARRPTRWSCARSRTAPRRVPVVVASSDAWVREHAYGQGAVVVGAESLLSAPPRPVDRSPAPNPIGHSSSPHGSSSARNRLGGLSVSGGWDAVGMAQQPLTIDCGDCVMAAHDGVRRLHRRRSSSSASPATRSWSTPTRSGRCGRSSDGGLVPRAAAPSRSG